MPEHHTGRVEAYLDPHTLKASLSQLVDELEPLALGSDLHFVPASTHFTCDCGFRNERSNLTLQDGQIISCINPRCRREWVVKKERESYGFEANVIILKCGDCERENHFPQQDFRDLKPGQRCGFTCAACGRSHWAQCRLDYGLATKERADHPPK